MNIYILIIIVLFFTLKFEAYSQISVENNGSVTVGKNSATSTPFTIHQIGGFTFLYNNTPTINGTIPSILGPDRKGLTIMSTGTILQHTPLSCGYGLIQLAQNSYTISLETV